MLYYKKITTKTANDSLAAAYQMIEQGSVVLDVGCGCGGLAQQLVQEKSCKVYAFEYNQDSVAICKKMNVFEQIICQDLNTLKLNDYPQYQSKFDYIVCADVLEHLLNPSQVLQILLSWLKPNGHFIISLPNAAHASIKANLLLNDFTYTDIGILDKTHLHFYTYKSIAAFLAENSLKIEDVQAVTMPLDGWQPHKISELPPEIVSFIKRDVHSHIMQYVMLCSVKKNTSARQNRKILENVTVVAKNSIPFYLKRLIVTKLPRMLKMFERIQQWKKS